MAFDSAQLTHSGDGWNMIAAFAEAEGSHRHAMIPKLCEIATPPRDVADAVHTLCMLHGRYPGIIDHAAQRNPMAGTEGWFEVASEGFASERALLAGLVSAAGPLPSTPGQADSEAAIAAQRHALEMLAQSDRPGCAIGAAIAVVIEWQTIRLVLDAAAARFGVTAPPGSLPPTEETAIILSTVVEKPMMARAVAFGVQQVLAQHHGLWDLLAARASARDHL